MSRRKEMIRQGLEIDFDLLDSDMLRCYAPRWMTWVDGTAPMLLWLDFVDEDDWSEEQGPTPRVMRRTLDDDREMAEGRRHLRLTRYKSYACLAELAERGREEGEFVIRTPPVLGNSKYVSSLDEARVPAGFGDPDDPTFDRVDAGFLVTRDIAEAQRFTHDDAIRLTVRIMEVLGHDLPGDNGGYWEPVRADVAEELHARARRRPRRPEPFYAMLHDLSREPEG
jgi:hypothetical protein